MYALYFQYMTYHHQIVVMSADMRTIQMYFFLLISHKMQYKQKSGVQFPLLATCIIVWQTSIIPYCLCLPSRDGCLVNENLCLGGSSCLQTCMTCALYSPRANGMAQMVYAYTREGNWSVESGIRIRPKTMYLCLYFDLGL